jgi:hypothetical protein
VKNSQWRGERVYCIGGSVGVRATPSDSMGVAWRTIVPCDTYLSGGSILFWLTASIHPGRR